MFMTLCVCVCVCVCVYMCMFGFTNGSIINQFMMHKLCFPKPLIICYCFFEIIINTIIIIVHRVHWQRSSSLLHWMNQSLSFQNSSIKWVKKRIAVFHTRYDMNEFSMLHLQCIILYTQMRYEDIYDGLEVYSKPATAESELYAQLKAFNILNILHSQIRFVNF